ncbi:MAG: TonB-dependent receptor [Acidobacteriota bacterium]
MLACSATVIGPSSAAEPGPEIARGTLVLRVLDADGAAVAGATVEFAELRRTVTTDAAGRVRLEDVPVGRYHVTAKSPTKGVAVADVIVSEGEPEEITLRLSLAIHTEEVVVSARPDALRRDEAFQPVDVLDEQELATRAAQTLGATLDGELGVSSTAFGEGASRPVIRGLGADRSRMLESGLGTGDVSSISPDHAVSVDPGNAGRIEIVRGPATLMYGSGAVGGVVNVLDDRIPDRLPDRTVSGRASTGWGTNAGRRSASTSLTGRAGAKLVWHAGGTTRRAGDTEIPGPAFRFAAAGDQESRGRLANTAVATDSWDLGLSRIFDNGYLGVAFSRYASLYGVPEAPPPAGTPPGGEEGPVRIDLDRSRWDLRGELDLTSRWLRTVKLSAGLTDYEHRELASDVVGTRFLSDAWETRLELVQRAIGDWSGSFGVQLGATDLEAEGDEAFLAPSATDVAAAFVFEELRRGDWRWLAGARWERQTIDTTFRDRPLARDVDAVSASFGVSRSLPRDWIAVATLSRATRIPTVEELASFGEHEATRSFEIGDPELDTETTWGLDLALRRVEGVVSGELDLFWNRIDGFIYERPVPVPAGVTTDLPAFMFTADDADFRGGEARVEWRLHDRAGRQLALELSSQYVRAERRRDGTPLPFIPPWRTSLGLHLHGPRVFGLIEVTHAADQDRVFCEPGLPASVCETPTDGYTTLGGYVGLRVVRKGLVHELILRGDNLTDELARNHVSRLKDFAPMPGRNVSLTWRVDF